MRDPWKKLLENVKKSGRMRDGYLGRIKREITLTPSDLRNQFKKQKGRCYWLNLPIDPQGIFVSRNPFAISVDRLDSSKDYTPDNIVICCRFANLGRGNCDPNDFRAMLNKLEIRHLTTSESCIESKNE